MSAREGTSLLCERSSEALAPGVIGSWDVGFALVLQRGVHVFCLNDVGLFGLFVENDVRQRFILVKQGDVARYIFADSHLGIAHGIGWAFGLDLVDDLLELHSQIFRECARFLPDRMRAKSSWAASGRWASC